MTSADKGFKAPRQRAYPVQAAAPLAEAFTQAEGRQPGSREDPCPWGTGDRHAQDLKFLAKLRSYPRRATAIVQAILVLHRVETYRSVGGRVVPLVRRRIIDRLTRANASMA
jgi:hypothetical protein